MADISIIGAGRLGTSLGRALASRGHRIRTFACRSLGSAKLVRTAVGSIIILCLPDENIRFTAARLAASGVDWRGKTVLHTSGVLPAEALGPLRKKGAALGSFHPAQSFPEKGMPPSRFRGVSFGLEGDPEALEIARGFVRDLGGRPLVLSPETKPLYHAACTLASNYPVILWQAALELLARAGVPARKGVRLIAPLAEGTLRSVKKLDPERALTGPIIRGDGDTVKAHLDALRRYAPEYLRVYRENGLAALETARKRGLAPGKIRAIRALLEGR